VKSVELSRIEPDVLLVRTTLVHTTISFEAFRVFRAIFYIRAEYLGGTRNKPPASKESHMTNKFAAAMRRATKATRAFNVLGATRIIQRTLASGVLAGFSSRLRGKPASLLSPYGRKMAEGTTALPVPQTDIGKQKKPRSHKATPKTGGHARVPKHLRRPLGEVLETLRRATTLPMPMARFPLSSSDVTTRTSDIPVPEGARFTLRSFTCSAGTREFKLYVPASAPERPQGVIVMLHGCTQNPDDFAAGTNMNAVAETHGLLIAYPAQTRTSNASSCWNWFEAGHQLRDSGEPAILAGLTRKLIKEFGIDRGQVYVAGLSAGAAMAVIIGETYPDLFSAIGVHSGLPYQSAGNVMSALAVMRGSAGSAMFRKTQEPDANAKRVRTIIFHGSADRTVHPSNAQLILDAASGRVKRGKHKTESGSANGRRFTQTVISTENGHPLAESWLIDGAGHAWSGGEATGSYTDTKGPDASREMVRFFLNAK
jgi:poly(hydroxyalkanoate) depolymerase family esterase